MSQTASVLAILAVHPRRVAATRLRALQYEPWLTAAGFEVRLWSFLDEQALEDWFGPSQLRRARTLLRCMRRLPRAIVLVRRADVVLVQREALPFGPPLLEWWAARRKPMIWDVDDAVWEPYVSPTAGRIPAWIRATGRKFERLCKIATEVWAGSQVLAAWCRRHNDAVAVLPTVVPVPHQRPSPAHARVAGWIGSHSTGPFLEAVLPAVARATGLEEIIVVGGQISSQTAPTRVVSWSEEAEEDALKRIRVGLYPIDRAHPLAEGKCGLKAILFMARGIPVVITPTATNAAIVRDGVEGLHASSHSDWHNAVQRLLDDENLWRRCSEAAWRRAHEDYSLEKWGPRVADRLKLLAASGPCVA